MRVADVARVRVGLVDVVGLKARMTLDLHRDVVIA